VLESIITARDEETKSSAGDKFETSRAMLQIEEAKNKAQLAQTIQEHKKLLSLEIDKVSTQIIEGSLVITSHGIYFIAIGIGKIKIEDQLYYCVSAQSPIAHALIGRKVGDQISFNSQDISVLQLQ